MVVVSHVAKGGRGLDAVGEPLALLRSLLRVLCAKWCVVRCLGRVQGCRARIGGTPLVRGVVSSACATDAGAGAVVQTLELTVEVICPRRPLAFGRRLYLCVVALVDGTSVRGYICKS